MVRIQSIPDTSSMLATIVIDNNVIRGVGRAIGYIKHFYAFSGLIQGLGTIQTPRVRVYTAPASSRGGKEM